MWPTSDDQLLQPLQARPRSSPLQRPNPQRPRCRLDICTGLHYIYIVRREVIVYCCTDGMQLVSHCVGDMTSIGCFFLSFQSRAQDPSQFIIIPGQIESQILSTMVDSEHCALYIYVGVSKASGSGTPKALKTSVCLQCWWWSVVTWSRKNKTIKL